MKVIPILKLIKSLSLQELHSLRKKSTHRQAAYIALLDMYYQTETKDEPKVKDQFKSQFPKVDFSETKSFLYKFILKGLTELNAKQTLLSSLYFDMISVDVLRARGLNSEALSMLKQVGNMAKKENYDLMQASALRAQKLMGLQQANTINEYHLLEHIHQEEMDALARYKEYSEALILYAKLMPILHKGTPFDDPIVAQLLRLLVKHPLVKRRNKLASSNASIVMFDFITNYYVFIGRDDLAQKACKDWIDSFRDLSGATDYMMYRYIFTLYNITSLATTKRDVVFYADKLKSLTPSSFENKMYQKLFSYELSMVSAMGWSIDTKLDWVELNKFALSDFLHQKQSYKLKFLKIAAAYGLAKGELESVEKFCNQILGVSANDKHFTLSTIDARLIYLALLFEQKRYSEMSSQLRTLNYYSVNNKMKNSLASVLKLFKILSEGNVKIMPKIKDTLLEKIAMNADSYPQFYNSKWLSRF
jgi:hypothetical protein